MPTKPKPKTELAIKILNNHIFMEVLTEDAALWVENESPQYGLLFTPSDEGFTGYLLIVSELYDADDVYKYLKSYSDYGKISD